LLAVNDARIGTLQNGVSAPRMMLAGIAIDRSWMTAR
jgi:hypothetical protein